MMAGQPQIHHFPSHPWWRYAILRPTTLLETPKKPSVILAAIVDTRHLIPIGVVTYGSIDVIAIRPMGSKGRIHEKVKGTCVQYVFDVDGKHDRGGRIRYNKELLSDPHGALHGFSTGNKVDVDNTLPE